LYWRKDRLVEHTADAVAPLRRGSTVAGTAVIAVLRKEGIEVLCGREAVELRLGILRAALVGSRWN
jgi:hypothetical protein